MKWAYPKYPPDKTQWHNWYAWLPVRIQHGPMVWLEVIQRRFEYFEGENSDWTCVYYREIRI